jgi:hypothetical protein
MKQPKPKPHVLLSTDPHCEGQNYETPCGSRVVKAGLLKSWEPGADIRMIDFRGICGKCLDKITLADFLKGRYVALAMDGELLIPARERENCD